MSRQVKKSSLPYSLLRYKVSCEGCGYRFATEKDLSSHNCPDLVTGSFNCNNCKCDFYSDETLKRHLSFCRTYDPNVKTCVCKLCGEVFDSETVLKEHDLKGHVKTQYQCKYCHMFFASHRNLSLHERVHEREPVSCSICKGQFCSFASLNVHIWQAHHQKMSPNLVRLLEKCRNCYKYYDKDMLHLCKKDSVTIEAGINIGPPFKCIICDSVFFKYSNFDAHMYSHTVDNNISDANRPNLKRGSVVDIPNEVALSKKVSVIADQVIPVSLERPYRCDICGCKFKYDFSLAAHTSSHNMIERKVIDEFAKIIQSHENGEEGYVIEAIDMQDLCKQDDQKKDTNNSKSHNGLLNLLLGHLPDEDLSTLGIRHSLKTENILENSSPRVESIADCKLDEIIILDDSKNSEI